MEEQVTEVEQEVIMTINNPRSTSVATIMACWFGLLKNNSGAPRARAAEPHC